MKKNMTMPALSLAVVLGLFGAQASHAQNPAATQNTSGLNAVSATPLGVFIKTLPDDKPPAYDEVIRLALAANPLGCEDHPHSPGPGGGGPIRQPYLWQREARPQILDDYEHKRAFFGCLDWHSSVNSTWMMVSLMKQDPKISLAPAIRNELERHFQKSNIDGELEFFKNLRGAGADFEKPYGYTWLLKLFGEARTWDDPEGVRISAAMEPLAKWMTAQYVAYLESLDYPIRTGVHPSTGLTMGFALDYTVQTHDAATAKVIHDTALRLFGNDRHCATNMEPVFGDFASPCLVEAALMSRLLDKQAYAKWLDGFLPSPDSELFAVYSKDIDAVHGNNRDTTGTDEEGLPNAHLIGLAYQRATDFLWMAAGLPASDPRVPVYRKLSDICAKQGFDKIGQAGYLGTHWLATYALMYENEAIASAPAAVK